MLREFRWLTLQSNWSTRWEGRTIAGWRFSALARTHQCLIALAVAICWLPLNAQSAPPVTVSPASATMLVGESRPFRAVDGSGHPLRNVDWMASESGIVEVSSGDEVVVTAQQVGKVTLTAHASPGSASAHIEVVGGGALPLGTVIWSSGDLPGCHSKKIMPAVPVANGPDVFEESQCADGTYIRAYTSDGVLLWRRKIGSNGASRAKPMEPATPSNPFNARAGSICDSVSLGMKEDAVAELLKARNLAVPTIGQKTWLIEEDGAQCKVWFDPTSGVVKKRKTLTTE